MDTPKLREGTDIRTATTARNHSAALEEMRNAAAGVMPCAMLAPSQCREILRLLGRLEHLEARK